jgi:hypothetical protein
MSSDAGTNPPGLRRLARYRLRSLLILTALAAVALVCYREIVGRIELEAPVVRTGTSSTIEFEASNSSDVSALAESFDREAVVERIGQDLDALAQRENLDVVDFAVYPVEVENILVLKYDYQRWGRSRFSVSRFQYVFDVADPVAQARNDAIEQIVFRVAKNWATHEPAIMRIEHHGRIRQTLTK